MEPITKRNNGRFDIIRWLALATSKDKPDLRYINVRKDKAVATNGHVLNQYNTPAELDIEVGLWEIVKMTTSEIQLIPSDNRFPDTDSVWPDMAEYNEFGLIGHDFDSHEADVHLSLDFATVLRAMKDDGAIKFDLFKIAAEGSNMTRAFVNRESGLTAIVLRNETRESLVMPIKA